MNFLTKLLGPSLPFSFGDVVSTDRCGWEHHHGKMKEGGKDVSVFIADTTKAPEMVDVAKNAVKRFKTIRHPNVLGVVTTHEVNGVFYIATERVTPLQHVIGEQTKEPDEMLYGIKQVGKGLAFINDDCQLVHGLVGSDTIFVTDSGEWKIGGLYLATEKQNLDYSILKAHKAMIPAIPPELLNSSWKDANAFDSFLLGTFLKDVNDRYQNCLKSISRGITGLIGTASRRMTVSGFISNSIFKSTFITTTEHLDELAIMEQRDRENLFRSLEAFLSNNPPHTWCVFKLLPALVNAIELNLSQNIMLLYKLSLKIVSQMNEKEFNDTFLKHYVKWFGIPNRQLRLMLLDSIQKVIDFIPQDTLSDSIFDSVATGFTDSVPQIREATIRSMLVFGPKVRPKTLQVGILRAFAKTQLDPEPVIRANTTVCIGKLAQYMQNDTRNRVLIAAFTRALKDSFVQSKLAGVLGFEACKEYFAPMEMATQILPVLVPLLVDSSRKIREEATKMVRAMLEQTVEFAKTIPEPEQPAPAPQKSVASPSLPASASAPALGVSPSPSPRLSDVQLSPSVSAEVSSAGGSSNVVVPSTGRLKLSSPRSSLSELDGWDDAEAAVCSEEEEEEGAFDGWDVGGQSDDEASKTGLSSQEKCQVDKASPVSPKQSETKVSATISVPAKQKQVLKSSTPRIDAKPVSRTKKTIQKTGTSGWDDDWEGFLNN